jgi:hypothetical protein
MTLSGFVRFNMMVEDAGETEMSLALWFKCLDVGSGGHLDWHGLSFFFEAKVDELLRRRPSGGEAAIFRGDTRAVSIDRAGVGLP